MQCGNAFLDAIYGQICFNYNYPTDKQKLGPIYLTLLFYLVEREGAPDLVRYQISIYG